MHWVEEMAKQIVDRALEMHEQSWPDVLNDYPNAKWDDHIRSLIDANLDSITTATHKRFLQLLFGGSHEACKP